MGLPRRAPSAWGSEVPPKRSRCCLQWPKRASRMPLQGGHCASFGRGAGRAALRGRQTPNSGLAPRLSSARILETQSPRARTLLTHAPPRRNRRRTLRLALEKTLRMGREFGRCSSRLSGTRRQANILRPGSLPTGCFGRCSPMVIGCIRYRKQGFRAR